MQRNTDMSALVVKITKMCAFRNHQRHRTEHIRIKPTPCAKLVGAFIDDQLSLDKYVSELCIRATRQTNTLRRIVIYLRLESRITMYSSFIARNFNYCNIVWHFCDT